MLFKKIAATLALLGSSQAMASPFLLGCDIKYGENKVLTMEIHADERAKTVNNRPAEFDESSITFERKESWGTTKVVISRLTGAITLTYNKEVSGTGKCILVEKKKF